MNYCWSRTVSFVGKLSLSQRVLYRRFYCTFSEGPLAAGIEHKEWSTFQCRKLHKALCYKNRGVGQMETNTIIVM